MHRGLKNCAMLSILALALAACSDPITLEYRYAIGAPSQSTPLVTDSYIAFGSQGGLTILEVNGEKRCFFPTHREVISAPKTDGNLIFFGSVNYIFYAINDRCEEVWKYSTRDRVKSDPLVADDLVFISSYDGHLYALQPDSGREVWIFPPRDLAENNMDLESQGFEGDNKEETAVEETVAAEGAEGAEAPTAEEAPAAAPEPEKVDLKVGDFSYSSPLYHEGVIYLGNLDFYMYAINADDGTLKWRFKTQAPVTSSPIVVDGVLYFGSNDGNIYSIQLEPLTTLWKLPTRDWVNSSPTFAEGSIFIGTNDRHILSIDAKSGQQKWSFETEGPAISIPVPHKNLVIGAGSSGDGQVYALARDTGKLFWKFRTGGSIKSDPVLKNDLLYVTSGDGYFYAFRIRKTTTK